MKESGQKNDSRGGESKSRSSAFFLLPPLSQLLFFLFAPSSPTRPRSSLVAAPEEEDQGRTARNCEPEVRGLPPGWRLSRRRE